MFIEIAHNADSDLSLEELEKLRNGIEEKEQEDRKAYNSFLVKFLLICLCVIIVALSVVSGNLYGLVLYPFSEKL